jgi:hypothetical protein
MAVWQKVLHDSSPTADFPTAVSSAVTTAGNLGQVNLKVNLESTSLSTAIDHGTTSDITDIGVNGALPIGNGGTGETTAAAVKNLLNVNTGSDLQIDSLGIGTAASGVSGEIRAANEVTAYYSSDVAMKTNIKPIANSLDKVLSLGGYNFDWKAKVIRDRGGEDGFFVRKKDVGILAHEIEKVIPEIVVTRKDGTKAVKYEKIVPLLIESIKELTAKVTRLENGNS